jgi:hypothetical protein
VTLFQNFGCSTAWSHSVICKEAFLILQPHFASTVILNDQGEQRISFAHRVLQAQGKILRRSTPQNNQLRL